MALAVQLLLAGPLARAAFRMLFRRADGTTESDCC